MNTYWKVGALAVALGLSFGAGHRWATVKRDRDDAAAALTAANETRSIEKQSQAGTDEARNDAQQSLSSHSADAAAAQSATDGLRREIDQLRARNASSDQRSQAASKAAGVLSDMYQSCDSERRALNVTLEGLEQLRAERSAISDYADRTAIAGEACAAQYNAVRNARTSH